LTAPASPKGPLSPRTQMQNLLLEQGSSEASNVTSELSCSWRSSGEDAENKSSNGSQAKKISFVEEAEIRQPLETSAETSPAGSQQVAQPIEFPRPSDRCDEKFERRVSASSRELYEMQDQMQMASLRRRSVRVSHIINQIEEADLWTRGISTGSRLPEADLWSRGISTGSRLPEDLEHARTSRSSSKPKKEKAHKSDKKKKTLFAHEGDEFEAMKERARNIAAERSLAADGEDSAPLGPPLGRLARLRYRLRRCLGSPQFEVLVGWLVASNAAIIGLEVEHVAQNPLDVPPAWYQWMHLVYAVIFTVELFLRIVAYGVHLYTDAEMFRWSTLDFVIVVSSWVDIIAQWALQESSTSALAPMRVARVLRITRLIRVTRLAKLMLWLKALRTLLYSVFVTLKSLVWAMVLLVLIMYVFAILLTQAATERMRELQAPDAEWTDSDIALKDFWGQMPKKHEAMTSCGFGTCLSMCMGSVLKA
ncbi:Scn11a, partial [Symbiodinium natans]